VEDLPVLVEHLETQLAIVRLNRPAAMNAVNRALRTALIDSLGALGADPSVAAIVITGAGERAFCSGQDLAEAVDFSAAEVPAWIEHQRAMYQAVRAVDKPVVAAWNGVAAGAGFQIGLCCDLRISYAEAKLGQPEIRAGLASVVGSYLMTLYLGIGHNQELSLSGRLISGERGYQLGLVNELVARDAVLTRACACAGELAKLPSDAYRLTKQRFREMTQADFDAANAAGARLNAAAYASGAPQRAMRAFLQQRRG
jgi:enoyl-CoA hydratase/carnithine racemase